MANGSESELGFRICTGGKDSTCMCFEHDLTGGKHHDSFLSLSKSFRDFLGGEECSLELRIHLGFYGSRTSAARHHQTVRSDKKSSLPLLRVPQFDR